ncbi:MAG: LuxR C-terminal-related transcriptional regulator [Gammaproteobacteria bacterium]|nr:LuxR C-terminal-related transcriptional regulator [Gammaproteobacteria bacterium]
MNIVFDSLISAPITSHINQPSLIHRHTNAATQLIHAVFDTSTDAIIGINADGHIRYWNRQFEQLSGFSQHNMRGKHCSDLLSNGNNQCPVNCKTQCCINQQHHAAKQRREFDAIISPAEGDALQVNIGSCYIPQNSQQTASTYFSIRKSAVNNSVANQQHETADITQSHLDQLTRRQQKVLGLAVEGLNTREIAQHLSISLETVRNHFKHIYPKLGVHSRAEAVGLVLRTGQL